MPIFARIAQKLADRGVSPNLISVGSMLAAVIGFGFIAWAVETEGLLRRVLLVCGVGMVQLRLICNLLDGMVAERAGASSMLGQLYNEAPDRISDLLFLVGFGLLGISPYSLFLGGLAAAMAMLTAYIRGMAAEIDARPSFVGPMAKPHRMAVLTIALLTLSLLPHGWVQRWWGGRDGFGLVESALIVIILGSAWTAIRRWLALTAHAKRVDLGSAQ